MDVENSSNETQSVRDETYDPRLHRMDDDIRAELLEIPIKSVTDKREFRNIKLSNGLTALLISVPTDSKDTDRRNDNAKSDEIDDDEDDSSVETARQKFRKKNRASCGLSINIGKFSDPPEIPGMTQILADMVCKGSEKYPQENHMINYMKNCGGVFENYTDGDQTSFSLYTVPESVLPELLDRFAHCFINPLMERDVITQVRKKIGENCRSRSTSNRDREQRLFGSFAQSGHPISKCTPGIGAVSDEITNEQLQEELIKFRKRHYSAHRMTFSIEARLPLDTLEKYVKEYFSCIPSNDLPPDDFREFKNVDPFDSSAFRRMYKMKDSLRDHNVKLSWIMPSLLRHYKSKPYKYLAWLLDHKGEGSLCGYLKKKKWCQNICSYAGTGCFGTNSLYTMFKMRLTLTDEGLENLNEVLKAVYSYINLMRREDPQKRIFDEIQNLQKEKFICSDEYRAPTLSEMMHLYSPADYMTGDVLCFEYEPNLIKACMNALTPDRANIIVYEKPVNDEAPETYESWFQREGTGIEMSEELIQSWKTAELMPDFKFPEVNIFVPDDFTMIPAPADPPRYPVNIHETACSEVWYKPDRELGFLESYMNIHCISPIPSASTKNMAMQDLFANILQKLLSVQFKAATAACLSYQVHGHFDGIWVEVSGFNQKLPLLLESIAKYIAQASSFIMEDLFRVSKEELLKDYSQHFLEPEDLTVILRHSITNLISYSPIDLYAAISNVEFYEFQDFVNRSTQPVYIRSLVQGNVTESDAIRCVQRCIQILNCQLLLPNTIPRPVQTVVPQGVRCCRVRSFDPHNWGSNVTNYYQFDNSSPVIEVMIRVFHIIIRLDLWNTVYVMQIVNQMDSSVYGIVDCGYDKNGYYITGRSAHEDTVEYVDFRIEAFRKYLNKMFREMADEDLLGIKEDLIKAIVKEFPKVGSQEEMSMNWAKIMYKTYTFDKQTQDLDIIKQMHIDELRTWMMNLTMDETDRRLRKLTTQVVGFDEAWEDSTDWIRSQKRLKTDYSNIHRLKYSLKYLTDVSDPVQERASDYYIDNIVRFRQGLNTFPLKNYQRSTSF